MWLEILSSGQIAKKTCASNICKLPENICFTKFNSISVQISISIHVEVSEYETVVWSWEPSINKYTTPNQRWHEELKVRAHCSLISHLVAGPGVIVYAMSRFFCKHPSRSSEPYVQEADAVITFNIEFER